jgi:hypothetical protein
MGGAVLVQIPEEDESVSPVIRLRLVVRGQQFRDRLAIGLAERRSWCGNSFNPENSTILPVIPARHSQQPVEPLLAWPGLAAEPRLLLIMIEL